MKNSSLTYHKIGKTLLILLILIVIGLTIGLVVVPYATGNN